MIYSQEEFMGKEIYLREYNYLGFYSCQMLVPSISEVYPMDDLVYNNRNVGKFIRKMVLDFEQFDPEVILELILPLEDSLNVEKYIGVIFENNFTMGEFKAQMHLLAGNFDEALELLEYGTHKMGHIVAEIIRMRQQEEEWSEYEEGLCAIFTRENVKRALNIIDLKAYFIDVTLHAHYNNMLAMYDRLQVKKEAYM